jgi:hypothetical protein
MDGHAVSTCQQVVSANRAATQPHTLLRALLSGIWHLAQAIPAIPPRDPEVPTGHSPLFVCMPVLPLHIRVPGSSLITGNGCPALLSHHTPDFSFGSLN